MDMNFRKFCLAHSITLLELNEGYYAMPGDLYHKESPQETAKASKEKSSMQTWAEREVEIACKRERGDAPEENWDYGVACYESALKAFNSLMRDGHSGMSIGITKSILTRLIDGKPLTPIEDTPDIWNDVSSYRGDKEGYTDYQCKRMSSLFKYVYDNGTVKYRDINNHYCVNIDNPDITYHSGLVQRIIDEMFPITMPYYPGKPMKVFCEEFLTDKKNGDFDTVGVIRVEKPDGESILVDRYFKESETDWKEISTTEYNKRKEAKIS